MILLTANDTLNCEWYSDVGIRELPKWIAKACEKCTSASYKI